MPGMHADGGGSLQPLSGRLQLFARWPVWLHPGCRLRQRHVGTGVRRVPRALCSGLPGRCRDDRQQRLPAVGALLVDDGRDRRLPPRRASGRRRRHGRWFDGRSAGRRRRRPRRIGCRGGRPVRRRCRVGRRRWRRDHRRRRQRWPRREQRWRRSRQRRRRRAGQRRRLELRGRWRLPLRSERWQSAGFAGRHCPRCAGGAAPPPLAMPFGRRPRQRLAGGRLASPF